MKLVSQMLWLNTSFCGGLAAGESMAEVLIIEDCAADQRLIRQAFQEQGRKHSLHFVSDGQEGIDFVCQRDKFAASPRPALILLDLNLPKKPGREVLKEIRGMSGMVGLPIVVFTTSDAREDIRKAYELGASSYIVKSRVLDDFFGAIHLLESYWFGAVQLL
jgi:chemotaxis family two-component system response regulator Rcp1